VQTRTAAAATVRRGAALPRWPFAAIAIAGVLAYVNALGHPFVFDDPGTVLENPTLRTIAASLGGGPAQSPTAGRPIANLTFAVNYLFGVDPWAYHAVNLAVHIACALVLFALLRRVMRLPLAAAWSEGWDTSIAAAVALIWVVHPLNSEIVNYVTQRTEALMALAFLTTLYCGVRAIDAPRPFRWQAASVIACALGMACKESMVTAPVMMLLLDATFTRSGFVAAVQRRAGYYGALFSTWIVLALLIVEGPRWRSAGFSSGLSPWTYLLNQPTMIVRYLRLVFIPAGLVLDYGEPVSRSFASVWPPATLVVLLLAGTVAAWRTAPTLAFFATWFFVTLAPSSSILPIATEVGAERRMYLPLAGVLMVLVLAGVRVLLRSDARSRTTLAGTGIAAVCLVLAALTIARNREFTTTVGVWQTVVDRWPTGRAHHNLGIALVAAGRRSEGIEEYRRALPAAVAAHYALAFEMQSDGRLDEALEHYRTFIRLKPDDVTVPRAYHQIGRALLAQGKREDALAAFREALARDPRDQGSLAGVADTLAALDRLSDAVTAYQQYLRAYPNSPVGMMNLGLTLVKLDRDAEARELFARVVQMKPDDVGAHVNLAYALANTGRYGDSVKEFRRAAELERDPAIRADIEATIAQLLGAH
jgi:Flp pilus assembly protein TadD